MIITRGELGVLQACINASCLALVTAGIPPVIGYNKERDEEFTAVIPLFESANVDELKAMNVREIEISEELQMIKDRVLEGPFVYQVRGAE